MTGKSEVCGTIMAGEGDLAWADAVSGDEARVAGKAKHMGLKQNGLSLSQALGEDQEMDQSMVQPRKRPGRASCLNQTP